MLLARNYAILISYSLGELVKLVLFKVKVPTCKRSCGAITRR
jgi:hypothetical protein